MNTSLYVTGVPGCPVFSMVYVELIRNLETLGVDKFVEQEFEEACGYVKLTFGEKDKELAKALQKLNPFFVSDHQLEGDELSEYCRKVWQMKLDEFKIVPVVL